MSMHEFQCREVCNFWFQLHLVQLKGYERVDRIPRHTFSDNPTCPANLPFFAEFPHFRARW